MKRKRFTEEQIIGVLKESEAGAKTDDICRRHGITTATCLIPSGRSTAAWMARPCPPLVRGQWSREANRLRELRIENAKLKRIVADQMLDISSMKELLAKSW